MAILSARRKVILLVLAFMILFGFAATGDEWIGWVRVAHSRHPRTHMCLCIALRVAHVACALDIRTRSASTRICNVQSFVHCDWTAESMRQGTLNDALLTPSRSSVHRVTS